MKRLTLIRHAKSSWDHPELRDIDRPLAQRGLRDAPRIGKYLLERWIVFDQIISSPAKRAHETAKLVAHNMWRDEWAIETSTLLYESWNSDGNDILEYVSKHAKGESTAIVGHNDSFERLALRLSQWEICRFPTCAVASFVFEIEDWSEVVNENYPELDFFVVPKMLHND